MVVHETYRDAEGKWVTPAEIRIEGDGAARRAFSLEGGGPVEIGGIEKMSKSKRNTVDPDEIIATYGADTARWFMLSDSPPDRDVIWTEAGVVGASKQTQRLWRLVGEIERVVGASRPSMPAAFSPAAAEIRRVAHASLAKIEDDIERLRFNVAIATLYEFANTLSSAIGAVETADVPDDLRYAFAEAGEMLVHGFAPMMPHLAEECWTGLGQQGLISQSPWPTADRSLIVSNQVTMPVQINGRKRADVTVPRDSAASAVEAATMALDLVQKALEGRTPKKIVVVPNRIVNVVV
jgi:leucyl-tRNA synthetase